MRQRTRLASLASLVALAVTASGCAAYQPVETTPDGIRRDIAPGDTVRVLTREQDELRLLVTAINDFEMRGRLNGDPDRSTQLRFDGIELLAVQRVSMRRTLLTVVLPVVAAAIIACNNDNCRTRGTIDAQF